MKLPSYFLLLVLHSMAGAIDPKSLFFLYEDRTLEVSSTLNEERVSIVAYLNASITEIKTTFITVLTAYKTWQEMVFLKDAKLKAEYFSAIDSGMTDVKQAYDIMQDLYRQLDQGQTLVLETTCVLYADVLVKSTLMDESGIITKKLGKLNSNWPIADITGEKLAFIERFISTYNSIGAEWNKKAKFQANYWNQLRSGTFPMELGPALEQLDCVPNTNGEVIKVLSCKVPKEGLNCELVAMSPLKIKKYKHLVPLNYLGVQVIPPEKNMIFVEPLLTFDVTILECDSFNWENDNIPLCTEKKLYSDCTIALQHNDINKVLLYCSFSRITPPLITRLTDEGILIQGGEGITILENGRSNLAHPPLIIYSTVEITITQEGKEFVIPPNSVITNPRTVKTGLSSVQIQAIVAKATWSDFLKQFNTLDYVEYVFFLLELLLAPLTIGGLVIGIKNRMDAHKVLNQRKHNTVAKKKRNYQETRAFLNRTE